MSSTNAIDELFTCLHELQCGPENDEYGHLRPTTHAYARATEILTALAGQSNIPRGNLSTNEVGGIRIEWVQPTCAVHLMIPEKSDRVEYFYHEVGDECATEAVVIEELTKWLRRVALVQ